MKSAKEALSGAMDIIAESISDEADYRSWIRKQTMQKGKIISAAKDAEAESVYEMYYEFEEPIGKLAGHRILALNRGEKEKFLTVKIEAPEEDILRYLEKQVIRRDNPYTRPVLKDVVEDSYKRLISASNKTGDPKRTDGKSGRRCNRSIRKESAPALDAAADHRKSCTRMGSGIPYRM